MNGEKEKQMLTRERRIELLTPYWTKITKEEIEIDYCKCLYSAIGSELAIMRLVRNYLHCWDDKKFRVKEFDGKFRFTMEIEE